MPGLALRWGLSAPAGRRYVVGSAGRTEVHVLTPEALRLRASTVPGSREMLALAPHALLARRCLLESGAPRDAGALTQARLRIGGLSPAWAWHTEGGGRWLAGQAAHARPALARRLREGRAPRFPPGPRDAPLLGGTVFGFVEAEHGREAALVLAVGRDPRGPEVALRRAFAGRSLTHTEGAWRGYLARLAGG